MWKEHSWTAKPVILFKVVFEGILYDKNLSKNVIDVFRNVIDIFSVNERF